MRYVKLLDVFALVGKFLPFGITRPMFGIRSLRYKYTTSISSSLSQVMNESPLKNTVQNVSDRAAKKGNKPDQATICVLVKLAGAHRYIAMVLEYRH